MGAAVRTDAIDGTDMIYDDGHQWDGHVAKNTYKYLGKKELLCGRDQDMKEYKRVLGQVVGSNARRSRVNLMMVEVINKDPNYIYSKRLWYFDPEGNRIPWMEVWDELERPWKIFEYRYTQFKTIQGEKKMLETAHQLLDMQRIHGGHATDEIKAIGKDDVSPKLYTIRSLQQFTY